jgi:hypothetical protein
MSDPSSVGGRLACLPGKRPRSLPSRFTNVTDRATDASSTDASGDPTAGQSRHAQDAPVSTRQAFSPGVCHGQRGENPIFQSLFPAANPPNKCGIPGRRPGTLYNSIGLIAGFSRRRNMDHLAIPQQVLVEHQTLAYIIGALRATIGWKFHGADFSRKLESLRFVGLSFQRHLKHMMALEEDNGYMAVVVAQCPERNDEVQALRKEHGVFRKSLGSILGRLRRVAPDDRTTFAKISDDLLALLEKLDHHSRKEIDLLQKALLTDEGGEG